MPNVSTYIQTSDHTKYLEIKAKGRGAWTEFIHNALNGVILPEQSEHYKKVSPDTIAIEPVKIDKPVERKPQRVKSDIVQSQEITLCQHFAAKGFCKHPKCPHSQFNPKNK